MQSAKLSGQLLVWKGSPLALGELRGDASAESETSSTGGAAPEQPGNTTRRSGPPRTSFLILVAIAAAGGMSGVFGLGWHAVHENAAVAVAAAAPSVAAPAAVAAAAAAPAVPAPTATVAIPRVAAKLAPDAVNPELRPPPIEPVAIAVPHDGLGGNAQPQSAAPPIRSAAAPAAMPAAPEDATVSTPQTAKAPPPAPAAAPPGATQSAAPALARSGNSATWRARGDALFAAGNLDPARQFYQLAADAGDGQAALQLGETYDPAFLAQAHIVGQEGNAASAARWYQQASKLGAPGAEILLKAVMADAPARKSD